VVAFVALSARVVQLQAMSGDRYEQLTAAQTRHSIPVDAERGSIFDRAGRDLALSIRRSTVFADPDLVTDPLGEAAKLAPVLGVEQDYLLQQLSAKPYRFAYLARTVPDDVAEQVRALGLPGVGLVPESARSYPAGPLAGAVLGRVGTEGHGTDGLEYLYDDLLTGTPGRVEVEQDPAGRDIPNTRHVREAARRGSDIVLTIDQDVQWQTEHSLFDQVQATGAASGMAAVVDVSDGDVLSVASVLGATADEPARVAAPGDRNAPLTELFAPGSTTKLITMAWALELGRVTPDTTFTVPYSVKVHEDLEPFYDSHWHDTERWTTTDILRESSNVGTIEIAKRMRNQELADGVQAFGLGHRTSIDWPGQPDGLLLPASEYFATGKFATAIGYGAAVTGMQMLDTFATIANGGATRTPHLLEATVDPDGDRHDFVPEAGRRVVSEGTAATMRSMLARVVTDGTGVCAAIPGYEVAGKTGTSKKLLSDGTYSDTYSMASFIGFAPADNPRFAAIVVLDAPALQYQFGGAGAAPVWSEVIQFTLTRYGVAPTDPGDTQFTAAQEKAQAEGAVCTVPHGDALAQAVAHARAPETDDPETDDPETDDPAGDDPVSGEAGTTGSLPADRSPSE
jgi:cell division protein FtsI (penicillin-binding protein 3)